jgi:hypothetical protein
MSVDYPEEPLTFKKILGDKWPRYRPRLLIGPVSPCGFAQRDGPYPSAHVEPGLGGRLS